MRLHQNARKILILISFAAIAVAAIATSQFIQPIQSNSVAAASASEPRGHSAIGPGGCTTYDSCRIYCQNPAHYDECMKSGGPWINGSPNPYVAALNVSGV